MIRRPEEKQKAVKLRKQGKSIGEIADLLNLATSTVSLWVRNIELSPSQKNTLTQRVYRALQIGRKKALEVQRQIRQRKRWQLVADALKEINSLTERDLFITGVVLYWSEGFKKDNRLGFANSDPAMIKLFLRWLEIVGVPKNDIRLRIGLNIAHKKRVRKVTKYWAGQTRIPEDQFQKPFFQKFKWKKEFPNPEEYFGVLRIRANNQGALFIKIKTWIEVLRENYARVAQR
ncbi:MAG: helix-turn-helix domain-containing protein [Candidatus Blackburnbacteria bacterium]|nr:helix-turn-helix domain-containing protein [Candidatus Blackburnbacteria bacterium]